MFDRAPANYGLTFNTAYEESELTLLNTAATNTMTFGGQDDTVSWECSTPAENGSEKRAYGAVNCYSLKVVAPRLLSPFMLHQSSAFEIVKIALPS